MSYGKDITERIPYNLSNQRQDAYSNSGEAFDLAINGQPFFLGITDETPYRRVTAKYRKDQLDTTREPGEQSLTGWWLRSQSSFHLGAGIKYFEPLQDEGLRFRFNDSRGVDVWTQGQVKPLSKMIENVMPEGPGFYLLEVNGNTFLCIGPESAYTVYFDPDAEDGEQLYFDEINLDGNYFYGYGATDGRYFYAVVGAGYIAKIDIYNEEPIQLLYSVSPYGLQTLSYVKNRLIYGDRGSLYELNPQITGSGNPLPDPFYGNGGTIYGNYFDWTTIFEGPQAIYAVGQLGTSSSSSIYKITLNTSQTNSLGFPELNVPTVIATMPSNEFINAAAIYMGTYVVLSTNRGVRVGVLSDNGDISYGPLLFENNGCGSIAFEDRFAYVAVNIGNDREANVAGLVRIDLSAPTSTSSLLFAYANDVQGGYYSAYSVLILRPYEADGKKSSWPVYVDFNGKIYTRSKNLKAEECWIKTGYIRYNMLDEKIFKYIQPRVDTTTGGMNVASVDAKGVEYNLVSYPQGTAPTEASVSFPTGPQEYLAFKFTLTGNPTMTGYQVKSLPAVPRQRMIQYPLFCYDHEADALNNQVGYEGYAWQRLQALESIEAAGDTVLVQDFRTGESFVGLIEELDFINQTPSDKRFTGFGGLLMATIRSVS